MDIETPILGFRASDTGILVYLKKDEETRTYIVRTAAHARRQTWCQTSSLSIALGVMSNVIGQHTNGFTTWDDFK